MGVLDDHAKHLLQTQHGVVGRFQLLERCTRGEVDSLVTRRGLERVERGVYRVAGAVATPEAAAMAAQLRARPGARITGPLVLALLELEPFSRTDPFTILTSPGRRLTNVAFRHREDPRPERRVTPIGPLRAVHPTVALLHSLVGLEERHRRVALHVLRRRGLWSPSELQAEVAALGRDDPAIRIAETLIGGGELGLDSAQEGELGRLLQRVDPEFEPQVWVTDRYRVDWFLRRLLLAVEYQGAVDHATAETRARDSDRAVALGRAGVAVLNVVAADLRDRSFPSRVAETIDRRARQLGRLTG